MAEQKDPVGEEVMQGAERLAAQKQRNLWLALALVAFVLIVGISTALRIQDADFSGGDRLYFSGYLDEAAKEKANREKANREKWVMDIPAEAAPHADTESDIKKADHDDE